MTESELQAIEARAEAATEGPWHSEDGLVDMGMDKPTIDLIREDNCRANADFIAAARTDIPALVAEVRRLREELKISHDRWRGAY